MSRHELSEAGIDAAMRAAKQVPLSATSEHEWWAHVIRAYLAVDFPAPSEREAFEVACAACGTSLRDAGRLVALCVDCAKHPDQWSERMVERHAVDFPVRVVGPSEPSEAKAP